MENKSYVNKLWGLEKYSKGEEAEWNDVYFKNFINNYDCLYFAYKDQRSIKIMILSYETK